jgi:protein SCO1/2
MAALFMLAACAREQPLPVLGNIADFELTAHSGAPFASARMLAGKVWVADFIFTHCNGPCPRMTSQMRQIQERLSSESDVRLVSFTVDPKRDTPEVLAAYARRQGARDGVWHFLTGELDRLHHLARYQFRIGNVDGALDHSTRFVLVDRRGRIRGYYRSFDDDMVARVAADARRLARET